MCGAHINDPKAEVWNDRQGSDAKKARYWRRTIGEAVRSGMSIREFCRRRRLKESQFYWWQHRLRTARPEGAAAKPGGREGDGQFRPGQRGRRARDAGIELVLNGGRRLRIAKGVDEETLRTVLAALEPARMLSFPAAIKVYLCTVPCDMRRSFDGLSMMAEHVIGCNPYAGHLLVFSNRRTDRVKILYWDRDGWAIWYKRLEAGTFQFPFAETGRKEIAAWELAVLLEGIDLSRGQRRKRYSLPAGQPRSGSQAGGGEEIICARRRVHFLLTISDRHDIVYRHDGCDPEFNGAWLGSSGNCWNWAPCIPAVSPNSTTCVASRAAAARTRRSLRSMVRITS